MALGSDKDTDVGILDDHPVDMESLEAIQGISDFRLSLLLTALLRGEE